MVNAGIYSCMGEQFIIGMAAGVLAVATPSSELLHISFSSDRLVEEIYPIPDGVSLLGKQLIDHLPLSCPYSVLQRNPSSHRRLCPHIHPLHFRRPLLPRRRNTTNRLPRSLQRTYPSLQNLCMDEHPRIHLNLRNRCGFDHCQRSETRPGC